MKAHGYLKKVGAQMCPHCNAELTPEEIKRLWGQLCKSKAKRPSKRVASERASKAAKAMWQKKRAKAKKRKSE